jgi:survival-of-motor-neuron-related-splicing factor 30
VHRSNFQQVNLFLVLHNVVLVSSLYLYINIFSFFFFDERTMSSQEDQESQLQTYKEQFEQIEEALKQDPSNEELLKLKGDLVEVINLTEDLLKLKGTNVATSTASNSVSAKQSAAQPPSPPQHQLQSRSSSGTSVAVSNTPSKVNGIFTSGSRCLAKYSEDGLWYEAVIDSLPTDKEDKYLITFVDYDTQTYVTADDLAPLKDGSKKRKEKRQDADGDDSSDFVIPKSLKILPTDSEEVRQSKRKRQHAIKSNQRLKRLEEEKNTRKSAWQEFTQKGVKKSVTAPRRESIFRSPDTVEGKVGVTGSGKPLTPSPQFKATDVAHVKFKIAPPS